MRRDCPDGPLARERRLEILDALYLPRLAPEEDALDGAEVQMIARHLDLELNFIVAADVAPRRIQLGQAAGTPDEQPAVSLDMSEADLGRILPGDGAVRERRGLLREGAFGELVRLAHEPRM
jgi:hypothetical protein